MILPDIAHTDAKILIVDDNAVNVDLLVQILLDAGYKNVDHTMNPLEVLPMYQEGHHDLILLDVRMPRMNGFEVIEALSAIQGRDEYLPVIVITAHAESQTRLKALSMGVRDFIGKPFDMYEVLMRIKNNLDVRALYNERRVRAENLECMVSERTLELLDRKNHLQFLLNHDQLTSLPNAYALETKVLSMVSQGLTFSLLMLEIKGYERLNHILGVNFGEKVLSEVSASLSQSLEQHGVFLFQWRMGQFVLLIEQSSSEEIENLRRVVHQVFSQQFVTDGYEVVLESRQACVSSPEHGVSLEDLMRRASLALVANHASVRSPLSFYLSEMEKRVESHYQLEKLLRGALERGEITLHYQPKYSWTQHKVVGAEALMRWHNPQLGTISPIEFIPIAEESGLIADLGLWAIRQALNDVAQWSQDCGERMCVAVNVSARQFSLMRIRGEALSEHIANILQTSCVSPSQLEIEITENAIMDDLPYALEELNKIRALGVSLAIDDFGTGHSSLAYLKNLPVSTIKIDRSFVHGMTNNNEATTIAKAMVAMGKALNLNIVAEGVELIEDATTLQNLGCDLAQGWYYGKPVPIKQLVFDALNQSSFKIPA